MHTSLTTALIALALLVLVGIVVQGLWKARRIAKRPGGLSVVVDDDLRREPTFGGDSAPSPEGELPAAAPTLSLIHI